MSTEDKRPLENVTSWLQTWIFLQVKCWLPLPANYVILVLVYAVSVNPSVMVGVINLVSGEVMNIK